MLDQVEKENRAAASIKKGSINLLLIGAMLVSLLAFPLAAPATAAGDDAVCPATDQRGVVRPQGAACDVGAYEYVPE